MKRTFIKEDGKYYRICLRCDKLKPLTDFHPSNHKPFGYTYICLTCSNRGRLTLYNVPEGYIKCGKCGEIKNKHEFYTKKTGPNGYDTYCKVCNKQRKRLRNKTKKHYKKLVIEPGISRLCSRCDTIYPDTDEFFYPSCKRWCRECRKSYNRKKKSIS